METGDTPSILRQENGPCQTTPHDNDFLEQIAEMESDRENNLSVATRYREIGSGLGAENADDTWLFAAKEIPCNECTSSFSSLQKYMEHHCMGTHTLHLKEENESDVSDLEDGDVENLTGEIIYRADGSAFIIKDSGESSQFSPARAQGHFSPVALKTSRTAGRDRAQQPSGGPMVIFPQVINTFHIATSLGKHLVDDQAFPNTSTFAGPVLHSFHVYDLRHKNNKDYLIGDGAAKNYCVSKDVANNVDLSEFDGCISDGKRKPVLMCFLCKLSFGYVKSFVSHAVHDHRMTLNKGEQKLLAFKYVSAIIQGIGKDKEPLLSFLEPKKLNLVVPHFSAADLISPTSGFNGLWKTFDVENGKSLQGCLAFLRQSGSPAVVTDAPLRNAEMSKAGVNLEELVSSTTDPPNSSRAHFSLLSGSNRLEQESSTLHSNGTFHIKSEPQELGHEDKDEGDYSNELDGDEEIGDLEGSTTSRDFPLLNQRISPSSTSLLKYSEKGTSSPFLTVSDDLERTKELFVVGDSSNDNSNHSRSDRDCFDLTKVQGGSPFSHSNHLIQRVDEDPNLSHQHTATLGNPNAGNDFPGNGIECPKCDTVLGSSRLLWGHMTMMHLRNSYKTLKCPKCNWHYKYQQTLDTHMKEKHPESGGSCSYCGTGQPHPRLARGESYTCGYKPFHCEVCNYSTTTKGNLSIHMQSDKHLNNVQSLQNDGNDAALSRSMPQTLASGTPSPPSRSLKQSPAWCCEVCDYETGVARNLRIHLTSEKHMHNVVMLQQNTKQIQHTLGLSLGLASTEVDFYQYYLAQNLGLTSVKLENSADQQMRISPSQLDPSMSAEVAPCLVNNELSQETSLVGSQLMGSNVSTPDKHPLPCHSDTQLKLFQCAVCSHFTTDSLEALVNHAMAERLLPEEEWRTSPGGDLHQCQLCGYSTQVCTSFQLHCETEKHVQRYQLAAHMRETGGPGCWKMKSTEIVDPMQLRCIACNYHGNSVEKFHLHATRPQHEAAVRIYKYLEKQERVPNSGSYNYHCVVCNYSTVVRLELLQHVFSSRHQQADGLRKLRVRQQGGTSNGDELSELFLVKDCLSKVSKEPAWQQKTSIQTLRDFVPYEMDSIVGERTEPLALREAASIDFNDKSSQEAKKTEKEFRLYTAPKDHPEAESGKGLPFQEKENDATQNTATSGEKKTISTGQHSLQPVVHCPLCQDVLSNKIHLHLHLTHLHSVASDCVEKLLLTVLGGDVAMPNKIKPVSGKDKLMETSYIKSDGSGKSGKTGDCISYENKNTTQDNTKYKESFQKEEEMLWKDSLRSEECDKASAKGQASPDPLTKPLGLLQKQHSVRISDHQMPKHCCNLCGQVFNTVQKLQIHSQCHTNQTCNLCQISFPSLPILRKHLEISHTELCEADIRQLCGSPAINGDVYSESNTKAFDKTPAHQHRLEKEDGQDQEVKASPTESGGSSLLEEMGSEPKQALLPFRKGPDFYMEKFLDPARPYKCSVCKESFTQKNILLVHYNSVSHLHKLKKVLHEVLIPVPPEANRNIDNKPYKCNICNVAYSQSSTLEIHMRSVLHQTKTRTARRESNSRAVNGNSVTAPSSHHCLTPPSPVSVGHGSIDSSLPVSNNNEMKIEAKDGIRNRSMEQAPVQPAHSPVQVHMPVQHELQQQAAFFQHQLINPAFWAHFPMTPEALLQFQQSQFLFPFYIPNTEFSFGPEVALHSATLGIPGKTGPLQQDIKQQLQRQLQMSQQKLQQQETHTQPQQQKTQQPTCKPKVDNNKSVSSEIFHCKNTEEKLEANDRKQDSQINNDFVVGSKNIKKQKLSEPLNSPPRIVLGANGNAAKALLENFGFELVIQYNENRQKNQKKNRIGKEETHNKYECGMCGKLFSNLLILKIHQEHVHGQLFPNGELEKFAQQYREAYDKLYPIDSPLPEASSPPPSLPFQPSQPPSQPALIAVKTVQTPPAPGVQAPQSLPPPPPPPPPPSANAPSQLPSLDQHLFPPLMMPHPGLPPQLALQLPSLDSLSQAQLSQLCQQQLGMNPDFLRQSQFKRPRTRITDKQLKVLRTYFDISNSPNEEQIQEMAEKSGLQQKVIKHWFRNTLFKERQRNKDSPYNFNIPPVTTLEDFRLEPQFSALEYYKTDGTTNKRSSRTHFTDYQLRVLQDFFDTNAYPKDDEIEQLSTALNLPTRVIVVWFQNARQKARKTYENQTDAKDSEKEKTNERYIRTSSMQYQCKKCTVIFLHIFDLISHQKKQCYKDEDDDGKDNGKTEFMDTGGQKTHKVSGLADSFKTPIITATKSGSSSPVMLSPQSGIGKISPKPDFMKEKPKQVDTVSSQGSAFLPETRPSQTSTSQYQQQVTTQHQVGRPQSQPRSNAITSRPLAISSLKNSLPLQIFQFQCDQCNIILPSAELWQEHHHMHFLATQNQFFHTHFLERASEMPYMIFDPNNPFMKGQLLSGTFSQMAAHNNLALTSFSGSISNTVKRKGEEKEDSEKDSGTSSEDQHRDKRLRTTITPEQLEVLYQKYLLDSNPTRKMLDHIALEVGLKKRVVQVWFQNTRARERKGQFRTIGPPQSHKKCPFCRALFKVKSALESHICSQHWHEAKQAGFSLPPSPLVTQEDEAESPNKCHNFEYPQLSMKADTSKYELPITSFTPVKPLQTQLKDFLSPCLVKFENSHDCEKLSINSADVTSDQNKTDFNETSSVNTAVSDVTTGDETHNDNESVSGNGVEKLAEGKINSSQFPGAYDEQFLFKRVSPSLSFSGKENEQHYTMQDEQDDNADQSEASSLADPSSPSPFWGGNTIKTGKTGGEKLGNKRFRTQMSNQQVKVLKACFSDYRTPTMQECEMLGNEIGLAKRVVQVWFQNARAKEKKLKINIGKPFMISQNSPNGPRPECTLCGTKYSSRFPIRDHIFSKQHIAKVQETLGQQTDKEKDFLTPTTVRQLMVQQELDRLKKATDILGMAAQQQGVSEKNAVHDHNSLTGCPGIYGLSSVQLPGMNGPSSLPIFPPSTPCLTSTSTGILGFPSPAAPSTARPLSSTLTKTVLQITSHPSPVNPSLLTSHLTDEKCKESEIEKKCDTSQMVKEQPKIKKQMKPSLGLLAMGKGGIEVPVDIAQLQVLQNAVASDVGSFLGGQFLPYFLPGLASCLSGQLPSAMQGVYLPSLFGVESLFPYGSIVPQAIPGLSPTAILQYQQSFQDSLQRQQQKQQQQKQKEQEQQEQKPPMTKPFGKQKDTFQGSHKKDESCSMESTKEEPQSHTQIQDVLDAFIIPSVMQEFTCRKCQFTFSDEESVRRHQKCFCYFGQPFPVLQDAMLHEVVSKYDCLACSVSLSGNEALSQHLQLSSHKEKTIKQAMRNAKEHARLLPHSVCFPNLNATSTSHSAAPSNNTYPQLSHSKPWPSVPFQAPTGKVASALSPTISLPSTVTSSLCSTSGHQTLIATGSCSDESDGELSQKLGDFDSLLKVKTKQASVLDDGFSSIQMDMFTV
ncbi:zinc finger homeobox protein 4-like isoform X3 [Scleropages formosus]|uniref:zinc finger homeobox protein 4-like isoform X3 n=1 Tax=Scleropages formosus TaxID=113540 RepID=UPI000878AAF1|nr:zinc finger homeobox protein 4-like isoform X3 [Scleropages formosus]